MTQKISIFFFRKWGEINFKIFRVNFLLLFKNEMLVLRSINRKMTNQETKIFLCNKKKSNSKDFINFFSLSKKYLFFITFLSTLWYLY